MKAERKSRERLSFAPIDGTVGQLGSRRLIEYLMSPVMRYKKGRAGAMKTNTIGGAPRLTRLLFVAFAVAIGVCAGVVVASATAGLLSSLTVLRIIEGVAAATACVFIVRFVSLLGKSEIAFFWALLWSALFIAIVLVVALIAKAALPNPAAVYFNIYQAYIEKNWKTDPNSSLIYFPLSYSTFAGRTFPRAFFVFDKQKKFVVDKYSDHLISPSCSRAKYEARLVSDGVYIVTFYINDPDEAAEPCLVTPQTVEDAL